MSEYHDMTLEGVLTEFAKRDTAGFLVWGKKIETAHKLEIGELKGERKGLLKANEAFAADNTRLRGEVAAKDAEIEKLKAALKTCVDYVKCEYGCGSECDAACEEIESGCKLREWTIEFGLETIGRKGGE